jgi:hypothetical protein
VFKKYLPKDDNEDREIDHILRIVRTEEGVATSMMIRASWEKAGFSYHQRDGTFYLAVEKILSGFNSHLRRKHNILTENT